MGRTHFGGRADTGKIGLGFDFPPPADRHIGHRGIPAPYLKITHEIWVVGDGLMSLWSPINPSFGDV